MTQYHFSPKLPGQPPGLPLQPVATASTAEVVVEQIVRLIDEGHLQPGDQLPSELDLAQGLNVARSTVREAKHALLGRGLLELRGTRGTFISARALERSAINRALEELGSSVESDLYETRRVVEAAAAEFAAARASKAELGALEDLLGQIEAISATTPGNAAVHLAFHVAIVEASHNQVLAALYKPLAQIIEGHHGPSYRMITDNAKENATHRELLEALKTGNPATAASAMRSHLDNVEALRQDAIKGGPGHSELES